MTAVPTWTVSAPRVTPYGDGSVTSVTAAVAERVLEFRLPAGHLVTDRAEPFLAATLIPAMKAGAALELPTAISPTLLRNVVTIQDIWTSWDRSLGRVPVSAGAAAGGEPPRGNGVAAFFSGGVDSFYTALKHRDDISALVFVHGFDVPLVNAELRSSISSALRTAAADLGKPLIEVETNLRTFSERYAPWSERYHGSALAAVALLLAPMFRRFYIPGSFPYSYLEPWASHPLLDPLWSTASLEIVHDGCEASRLEKVRAIRSSDSALRTLRVCWEDPRGARNCGHCEKCLRTMVNLELTGGLRDCPTFDRPLDLGAVARVPVPDACARMFIEENLRACDELGGRPRLARALRASLSRTYYRGIGPLFRGDLAGRVSRRLRRLTGRRPLAWDYERSYAFAAEAPR